MYFNNSVHDFKREIYRSARNSNSNLAEPPSEFVFKVLPIHRIKSFLFPPIYKVSYEVQKLSDGKTLARASEYVFGGGLVGIYLRAFFGEGFSNDRE